MKENMNMKGYRVTGRQKEGEEREEKERDRVKEIGERA